MNLKKPSLKPRKTPVQQRSSYTVDALHQATIQVLLKEGLHKTTTIRIAERAGVSIGSLYQYYPNKQSLFLAIVRVHLDRVAREVRNACECSLGQSLEIMARQVVSAYIRCKLENANESRALYAIPLDTQKDLVTIKAVEGVLPAVEAMLESCSDRQYINPKEVAFFVITALIGPTQFFLTAGKSLVDSNKLENNLYQLIIGYLCQVGSPLVMDEQI